jgi:hypothetical protein
VGPPETLSGAGWCDWLGTGRALCGHSGPPTGRHEPCCAINSNGGVFDLLVVGVSNRHLTDLLRHSRQDLDAVALALNTRPRETLGWRTPAEALDQLLQLAQHGGVATTG